MHGIGEKDQKEEERSAAQDIDEFFNDLEIQLQNEKREENKKKAAHDRSKRKKNKDQLSSLKSSKLSSKHDKDNRSSLSMHSGKSQELKKNSEEKPQVIEEVIEEDEEILRARDSSRSAGSCSNLLYLTENSDQSQKEGKVQPSTPLNEEQAWYFQRCQKWLGVQHYSLVSNVKRLEEVIVLKSIYDQNLSKLDDKDKVVFKGIVMDIFKS